MKAPLRTMLSMAGILVSTLYGSSVYFGPNVKIVTISNDTPPENQVQTRKKHTAVPILLQGLAQSCNNLGTVVVANNQKEKQQGILNILGTVFNTAAQLSTPQNNQTTQIIVVAPQPNTQQPSNNVQPQPTPEPLPTKLAYLTDLLITELKATPLKDQSQLPPTLALINGLDSTEKKLSAINLLLSSQQTAQQYLSELFTLVGTYINEHIPELMLAIKEQITSYISGLSGQQPSVNTQEETNHINQSN